MPVKAPFEIASSSQSVDFWTDTRLPFEPKVELRDARDALRKSLASMPGTTGQMLFATYRSEQKSLCDVENVLFYNVGPATFARLTINGLSFARLYESPGQSPSGTNYAHHHRYEMVDGSAVLRSQVCPNCSLRFDLARLSSSSKPHEVWWSAAMANVNVHEPIAGPFELNIAIELPTVGRNVANFLKPLLDGLISALHTESQLDPVAIARLAFKTGWDSHEIVRRLLSPAAPLLGPIRLLSSYREFVKWNPADHLCSRCTIIARAGPSLKCEVQVSAAE